MEPAVFNPWLALAVAWPLLWLGVLGWLVHRRRELQSLRAQFSGACDQLGAAVGEGTLGAAQWTTALEAAFQAGGKRWTRAERELIALALALAQQPRIDGAALLARLGARVRERAAEAAAARGTRGGLLALLLVLLLPLAVGLALDGSPGVAAALPGSSSGAALLCALTLSYLSGVRSIWRHCWSAAWTGR